MDLNQQFFSVSQPVKMLGTRFIPTVCYKLDSVYEPTIREMVKAGTARVYPQKVRFVSGKAVVDTPKAPVQAPVQKPKQDSKNQKRVFD